MSSILAGTNRDLASGFLEGLLREVAADEPALEPSGPGGGGGDEPALGLCGDGRRRVRSIRGGVLVDLSGFVDQDGAVLLGAEASPVGEVAEVDGGGLFTRPVLEAQFDQRRRGLLAAGDQSGRAVGEELFHRGGGEVGEVVSGDEDVVARVHERGVDRQLGDRAGLAAAHGAAVAEPGPGSRTRGLVARLVGRDFRGKGALRSASQSCRWRAVGKKRRSSCSRSMVTCCTCWVLGRFVLVTLAAFLVRPRRPRPR